MSPELERNLRADHPLLYSEPYLYGDGVMRCGSGWWDILERLSAKLEKLIWAERDPSPYRARCVKEKFGTLRFYLSRETPEMSQAIAAAEAESAHTCEHCGEPGTLRGKGWVRTLCDSCQDVAEREKAKPKP